MLQEERVGYKKGGCVKRREGSVTRGWEGVLQGEARVCNKAKGGCVTRKRKGVLQEGSVATLICKAWSATHTPLWSRAQRRRTEPFMCRVAFTSASASASFPPPPCEFWRHKPHLCIQSSLIVFILQYQSNLNCMFTPYAWNSFDSYSVLMAILKIIGFQKFGMK